MAGRGISFVYLLGVLLAMSCKCRVTSNSRINTMAEKFQNHMNMYYDNYNWEIDLVFVLDQSGSIEPADFKKILSFMKSALSELSVVDEHTHVSVIRFGTGVTVDVRMDQKLHKCALFHEIENLFEKYEGGWTNTEAGLQQAKNQLANASRNGAVKLVITVTDGVHNRGEDPKSIATEMKNNKIIMFAFGIGKELNYLKLADIASRGLVNKVDGFNQFKELAEVIYRTSDLKFFKKVDDDKCEPKCKGQSFCGCECFGGGRYQCVCPPGYHRSGNSCKECSLGYYMNTNSTSSSCTACPEHMVTNQKGTKDKSRCECKKGFISSPPSNKEKTCQEKFCNELKAGPHDHWRIDGHCNRRYLDICNFTCNDGFVTNDPLETQCKQITWSNSPPRCKAITCGLPPHVNGTRDPNCINNKGGDLSNKDYGAVCTYSVKTGYRLTGDNTVECKKDGRWHGNVQTALITCPVLQGIKNGLLANPLCSNPKLQRTLGLVCTYHCTKGYQHIGVHTRHCREDGTWQPTSDVTFCKDIVPPTITTQCPQNIYVETNRSMPTASVKWNEPVAEDNSKVTPRKTIRMIFKSQEQPIQKLEIPHKFKIGKTTVEYTFTDGVGLKSSCAFDVVVEDNEPPMIDSCPKDETIITEKQWTNVSWTEPKFTDNSGNFSTQTNERRGEKIWGKYLITYTASDRNGNSATCRFTISVQPNKCPILDPPINGARSCDVWLLGKFCTIHCDDRFEFSKKPEPLYVCGASGKWNPEGSTPWPDCSKVYNPKKAGVVIKTRVGIKTAQYYKGDCNNKTVQTEIKKKFIEIFSKSLYGRFGGGCTGNKQCKVENVIVKCGKANLTILGGNGNRKKRDIADVPIIIEFFFTASLNVDSAKVNQSDSQQLKKSLPGVLEIKQTMENISKELNDGKIIDVKVEKEAEFRCELGQFLKNGSKCVDCPVGTYQIQLTPDQETPKDCIPCPKGSFNNLEAQLSCTKCSLNKTTHKTGAKNESYCLSPCSPGSFSTTGLETCVSCPEGQFQNESAQTTCKKCPQGTTTPQRGAVYERDCQVECAPGNISDTGLTPCSPCKKNTYQPKSRQRNCLPCPYPKTTLSDGRTSLEHCIEPSHTQ